MSAKSSGGQPDNHNAQEGRRWREAIKRALAREGGDINKGLDKLASRLVNQAIQGKPWAVEHIADRIDGKAVHHVEVKSTITRRTYAERLSNETEPTLTPESPAGPTVGDTVQ